LQETKPDGCIAAGTAEAEDAMYKPSNTGKMRTSSEKTRQRLQEAETPSALSCEPARILFHAADEVEVKNIQIMSPSDTAGQSRYRGWHWNP
jgi:hypothetical protein